MSTENCNSVENEKIIPQSISLNLRHFHNCFVALIIYDKCNSLFFMSLTEKSFFAFASVIVMARDKQPCAEVQFNL